MHRCRGLSVSRACSCFVCNIVSFYCFLGFFLWWHVHSTAFPLCYNHIFIFAAFTWIATSAFQLPAFLASLSYGRSQLSLGLPCGVIHVGYLRDTFFWCVPFGHNHSNSVIYSGPLPLALLSQATQLFRISLLKSSVIYKMNSNPQTNRFRSRVLLICNIFSSLVAVRTPASNKTSTICIGILIRAVTSLGPWLHAQVPPPCW